VQHPEWSTDPRLANRADWSEHMEAIIRPGVEAWAASITKLEAATRLAEHGVAAGPVNSAADIVADPHVQHRGLLHDVSVDGRGVAVVGNPIAFDGESASDEAPRWPLLGEGTDRVLAGRLGLGQNHIDDLRSQGVIR
jgi:formyl-CoA transferase